jgi:hypothetical protein
MAWISSGSFVKLFGTSKGNGSVGILSSVVLDCLSLIRIRFLSDLLGDNSS